MRPVNSFCILIFSVIFFTTQCWGQNADSVDRRPFHRSYKKDISLLAGYNQGKYAFAEIGLSLNEYGTNRHPYSIDYFISSEIKLHRNGIIGPKIGVWVAGGFAMGLNLIYYTDFDESSLVFRPEIGIGVNKAKLVYGFNWAWTKALSNINRHQIGVVYCFVMKRLKSIEE